MDSYLQERYERRINGLRIQVKALEEENEYLKGKNTLLVRGRKRLEEKVRNLMKLLGG